MIELSLERRWTSLTPREQLTVLVGALVLVGSLVFAFVVDPLLDRLDLLDRKIARKEQAMHKLALLGSEYEVTQARLARLEQRMAAGKGKMFLLPYLEEAAADAQVREHIVAMRPQMMPAAHGYKEISAELRLDGVQWPQLLNLLVTLETSPHLLRVKRLQVKPRFDAPYLLEVALLVSTYETEQ